MSTHAIVIAYLAIGLIISLLTVTLAYFSVEKNREPWQNSRWDAACIGGLMEGCPPPIEIVIVTIFWFPGLVLSLFALIIDLIAGWLGDNSF
jgi:hypothetical protein